VAGSIAGRTRAASNGKLVLLEVARCICRGALRYALRYATALVHHLSRSRRLLRHGRRAYKCCQRADNGKISDHWTFLPLRPVDNACGMPRFPAAGGSGDAAAMAPIVFQLRWPSRSRSGSRVEHRTDKPELTGVCWLHAPTEQRPAAQT